MAARAHRSAIKKMKRGGAGLDLIMFEVRSTKDFSRFVKRRMTNTPMFSKTTVKTQPIALSPTGVE